MSKKSSKRDSMEHIASANNPEKREWDVIIVGTGMGGAVFGYALAKAGKSVLFCEKGRSHLSNTMALKGDYAENLFPRTKHSQLIHYEFLTQAGRWSEEIEDASATRSHSFIPFIGSGTGGSTALYGMALERFFPADFTPKRYYPNAEDTTLPERWPITYEELLPYYEAAERLFRVRGTTDSLRGDVPMKHFLPPPPLSPGSKELHDFLISKRLHPYYLPAACEFVSGCKYCQGYLCDKDCKNDSTRICLKPAISYFGAQLLDECEVLRLEEIRGKVTCIVCYWRGRQVNLRGRIVVLAAGTLGTPRVLLNSASPAWPNGLANKSGLVGRNLMRHYVDLYAIVPKTRGNFPSNFKEIAFNDYYTFNGQKFGTVQSFGALPPASILVNGMEQELKEGPIPLAGLFFKLVKPGMRRLLTWIFSRRIVLATIMEDLPYRDNRVMLSDQTDNLGRRRFTLKYRIREHDRFRIETFRKKISSILKPYPFMLIKQAENNERIAHACGTCRFGLNPKESVLDANNCAHGISNLYVVDSSFFPSSGGTNPGLTIAANALRVADHLVNKWNNE